MDTPSMIPISQIQNDEVARYSREARDFLLSHAWCGSIERALLAWAAAGVLGVFLFQIRPTQPNVDKLLWVIVGDLPSAYLVAEGNPLWTDALTGYVREMRRWVAAVRAGQTTSELIPVAASPTPDHADMLEARLNFIDREILSRGAEIQWDV